MLSISTSWMTADADVKNWLTGVKAMGFDAIELSYKVTKNQLRQAEAALEDSGLKVSSIHNFCPMPDDEPTDRHPSNYYRLSSLDEHERRQAVKWTKMAIETAGRVGAGAVVIHAGTLDFEDERSPRLYELFVNGQKNTEIFSRERERILTQRQERKGPFLKALEESLDDVASYSRKKKVKIGLETRYYPLEIPNFDEIGYFLGRFEDQDMGYWHDVGHAEINGRLGIRPHKDFLSAYKDRLIGVHLHGIQGRRDHLAPFDGDMDLDALLPYFGPKVIKVVEAKPFASEALIRDALKKLRGKSCRRK